MRRPSRFIQAPSFFTNPDKFEQRIFFTMIWPIVHLKMATLWCSVNGRKRSFCPHKVEFSSGSSDGACSTMQFSMVTIHLWCMAETENILSVLEEKTHVIFTSGLVWTEPQKKEFPSDLSFRLGVRFCHLK